MPVQRPGELLIVKAVGQVNVGGVTSKWVKPAMLPVPFPFSTVTLPDALPATVAVISVLEFTVNNAAFAPPNFTPVTPEKSVPVITTVVPQEPLLGLKAVTVGTWACRAPADKPARASNIQAPLCSRAVSVFLFLVILVFCITNLDFRRPIRTVASLAIHEVCPDQDSESGSDFQTGFMHDHS